MLGNALRQLSAHIRLSAMTKVGATTRGIGRAGKLQVMSAGKLQVMTLVKDVQSALGIETCTFKGRALPL